MDDNDLNQFADEKSRMAASMDVGRSHKSLNQAVVDALREAIFRGDFKPGDRLTEIKLAEMFNVSRNPIREALRVLNAEGIVEINPRKGARVPLLSLDEIEEIIELRAELEGMSARFAARRCTGEMRATLRSLLADGDVADETCDTERLIELNRRFHDLIAEAGKNRFLATFMRSLHERTLWLFESSTDERVSDTWKEHRAILEAVIGEDAELSSVLAARHVKEVGKTISRNMASESGSATA